MDGDNATDLIVGGGSGDVLRVYLNLDGSGVTDESGTVVGTNGLASGCCSPTCTWVRENQLLYFFSVLHAAPCSTRTITYIEKTRLQPPRFTRSADWVTGQPYAADMDADGDMDILVASVWMENLDGQGDFYTGRPFTEDYLWATDATPVDINGDGLVDVLYGMQWYENTGSAVFGTSQFIDSTWEFGYADAVLAVDVDSDGDIDVVASIYLEDAVIWYENLDGKGTFSTRRNLTTSANGVVTLAAGDINGDGRVDIVSGSDVDDRLVWYENLGVQDEAPTPTSTVAPAPPGTTMAPASPGTTIAPTTPTAADTNSTRASPEPASAG